MQTLHNSTRNIAIAFITFLFCLSNSPAQKKENKRPNILLIVTDDMGYSDLGCYGSEISTPNLDSLSANGLRFRQFYNTARCCPTRASLLTGLYAHQAGLGWMTSLDQGFPGYRGEINNSCVTIPEALKNAGYSSYASGKWHINLDANCEQNSPNYNWPKQRGFDRYFGFLKGASDYFNPDYLYSDNNKIKLPEGSYLTDAISDTAVKFIYEHSLKNSNPFFMYVAYNAPHFPLHAKRSDIEKYRKKYLEGWDKLRKERFEKMKRIGLLSADSKLSPKTEDIEEWESLSSEKKNEMALRMAIYAAQIDCLDQGVGRIVSALKEKGMFENTVIFFVSDNGGCAEPVSKGSKLIEDLGTTKSYESYGYQWANLSNTPLRIYKRDTHEGGISTPLIISWPNGVKAKGEFRDQVGHVIDFMPTILELAKAEYPKEYNGHSITPFEGTSLVPFIKNEKQEKRTLYFEHIANRGLREGNWKLVCTGTRTAPFITDWELYDVSKDRGEMNNMASEKKELVKELSDKWYKWAERTNVLPIEGRGGEQRIKKSNVKSN